MKKNYLSYVIYPSVVVWLGLICDRMFALQIPQIISKSTATLELVVSIFILIATWKLYRHSKLAQHHIVLWLTIANSALAISNILWYLLVYVLNNPIEHILVVNSVFEQIILLIWIVPNIIFLWQILKYYIFIQPAADNSAPSSKLRKIRQQPKMLVLLGIIDCIIIAIFFYSVHHIVHIFSLNIITHILTLLALLMLFDCAILCLIYAASNGLIVFLLGTIGIIAGAILFQFIILAKPYLYTYSELFGFLGMLLNWFGLLIISSKADYDIKIWINKYASIKSEVVFWCFSMSTIGFLCFFILAYIFDVISSEVFFGLPLYIMLYSAIVMAPSIAVGRYFETPFKQLKNNIRILMLGDSVAKIDNNFLAAEFKFLQKSIVESFKYRDQTDTLKHEFGMLAANVAHDIKSPLTVLGSAIKRLKKLLGTGANHDITQIEYSLQTIRNISSQLLSNYQSLSGIQTDSGFAADDDGNTPRYIILSTLIKQFIATKPFKLQDALGVEYTDEPVTQNAWSHLSPAKFTRILANLLNKLYSTSTNEQQTIRIHLSRNNNEQFLLTMQNGGYSTSENLDYYEHDIANAREYLHTLGGKLTVHTKPNSSTTVRILIPFIIAPPWFNPQIYYSNSTSFVVLDDCPTIIALWQRIFTSQGMKCTYFLDVDNFMRWQQKNNSANIILFVDYDLHDKIYTGIDIIAKFNYINAYLVTEHAEEPWLQILANQDSCNLIPKSLIDTLEFINTTNNETVKKLSYGWL